MAFFGAHVIFKLATIGLAVILIFWSGDTPKSVGDQAPSGASINRIGYNPVALPTFKYNQIIIDA